MDHGGDWSAPTQTGEGPETKELTPLAIGAWGELEAALGEALDAPAWRRVRGESARAQRALDAQGRATLEVLDLIDLRGEPVHATLQVEGPERPGWFHIHTEVSGAVVSSRESTLQLIPPESLAQIEFDPFADSATERESEPTPGPASSSSQATARPPVFLLLILSMIASLGVFGAILFVLFAF